MLSKNESYLKDKFPHIFQDKNFYFECDDGWLDLIDTLCEQIQWYLNWKHKDIPVEDLQNFEVIALQIKEKFGGLRFNYQGGDDQVRMMVHLAESFSYKICSACGNKGSFYNDHWKRTHCPPCEEIYQNKINQK